MWTALDENFNSNGLDPATWQVTGDIKDHYLYKFVDSPATINVNQTYDRLELTMLKPTGGYDVIIEGETINIPIITGEIQSIEDFSYGIFECYATLAYNKGSFPAFWLYNDTICTYSKRNELDIVECKKDRNATPTFDVGIWYYPTNCGDESHHAFNEIDELWSGSHIYKCEYTPSQIKVYRDNVPKYTLTEDGQYWYPDQKMHVRLSQQAVRFGLSNPSIDEIVTPQTSIFHWVKVHQYFLAPEITCPNLICSSETAVMDVDSKASNVSWSLTPVILFSGNKTGTGKTATIIAATGASGQGKITYSFQMPSGETFTVEKTFWVGKPGMPLTSPSGYPTLELGLGAYQPISLFKTPGFTSGNINWLSTGSITPAGSTTGTTCTFEAINLGTGNFYVTVQNTCGTSPVGGGTVNVVSGGGGQMMLVLSPNPTSTETDLSIETISTEVIFDNNEEWELEIYDTSQSVKEKQSKLKGKSYKIHTLAWKEGVYFVRVKYKNEVLTNQLVVKH